MNKSIVRMLLSMKGNNSFDNVMDQTEWIIRKMKQLRTPKELIDLLTSWRLERIDNTDLNTPTTTSGRMIFPH